MKIRALLFIFLFRRENTPKLDSRIRTRSFPLKTKYRAAYFAGIVLLLFILTACNRENKRDEKTIHIASVNNPNLMFANALSYKYPGKYKVHAVRSPMEMMAIMKKAEMDMIFHTFQGGIKLYKKGLAHNYFLCKPYIFNAVHIVSRKKVDSIKLLSNKTVHIAYKQGTPELLFRLVLKENGINPGIIKTLFLKPFIIIQLFLSKKIDYAVLPEFFVSQLELKTKEKLFITPLTSFLRSGNRFPVGAIFVKKGFDKIPLFQFHEDVKNTINFIYSNSEIFSRQIAKLYMENYRIKVEPKVLAKSLQSKRLNFDFSITDLQIKRLLKDYFQMTEENIRKFLCHE